MSERGSFRAVFGKTSKIPSKTIKNRYIKRLLRSDRTFWPGPGSEAQSEPPTARTSVRSRGSASGDDCDVNEVLEEEVFNIMDMLCQGLTFTRAH